MRQALCTLKDDAAFSRLTPDVEREGNALGHAGSAVAKHQLALGQVTLALRILRRERRDEGSSEVEFVTHRGAVTDCPAAPLGKILPHQGRLSEARRGNDRDQPGVDAPQPLEQPITPQRPAHNHLSVIGL
jgi:hypothetical protein